MPLPTSGPLTFDNIQTEFGGTNPIGLNEYYAGGGLVPSGTTGTNGAVPSSGAIGVFNFYGTSNRPAASFTFTSSVPNASLNITTISGYVAGITDVTVIVNPGVWLYSTTTGGPGLALSGGTSGDTLTLINQGFIAGQGADGTRETNAGAGGPALSLGFNTTINNTNGSAYIGGGGGGGGGCAAVPSRAGGGGGGAGGGNGGGLLGGGGGGIGAAGTSGDSGPSFRDSSGGGGGRIFPGVGGTTTLNAISNGVGGGAGGAGGAWIETFGRPAQAGAGGSANAAGGDGFGTNNQYYCGGGGGGWGASGGRAALQAGAGNAGLGGAGGQAVQLNGRSVTWVSGDTSRVYGAVS